MGRDEGLTLVAGASTTGAPGAQPAGPRPSGVRGRLRVYLAVAPAAGKTYAMLAEGRRSAAAGLDVVVGLVETHHRTDTDSMLRTLDRIPLRQVAYRGATFGELDVEAVLVRRPAVVLVDELAHTCVPGSRHEKRWEDVEELLDAGIDVITALNVQHRSPVGRGCRWPRDASREPGSVFPGTWVSARP